jgi:hypothetical protein
MAHRLRFQVKQCGILPETQDLILLSVMELTHG